MSPTKAMVPSAVMIAGLALSAHQGFSSNLYTLVSDTFPRRAVGSVSAPRELTGALTLKVTSSGARVRVDGYAVTR